MLSKDVGSNNNYFVIIIAAIAGLGGFLFGFDSSVIADTKDQIMSQFSLTDVQWSLVVSISLLGSILGIPLSGMVADRLSRKTMLLFVAIGFTLGTAFCAQASHLYTLYVGRFIIGVCIGIASYISPLFIAEIAPASSRGALILMNGLAITFGQAFSFLIGYFIHDLYASSWRLLFWIGVIPALLLLIGLFFIPHSPRWLLAKFGPEHVKNVLSKIRNKSDNVEAEIAEIRLTLNQYTHRNIGSLFTAPIFIVLLVGLALGIFQQFSGINAIMYYGPVIFEKAGFYPVKNAILATFWMGLLNFIFTAFTLYVVDKVGRRYLLQLGTLLAAISLILVSAYYEFHVAHKWLMFVFMSSYIIGYCISVGSLFWVLISEIYPLQVRGLAMSVATVTQWAANFIVSISFLSIFNQFGEANTFLLLACICLLAFIFIHYFVPETTNISLERIENNIATGKKVREIGQPVKPVSEEPILVK